MILVIMAAGIGSRFGKGIKQLDPVGPSGEIIMDYSIHDAIAAGFDKICIIIRKDIETEFKEVIGDRIEAVCRGLGVELSYAFQDMNDIPEGYSVPADRKKPWGTGQAVLACRDQLTEPFAVINADDYYGKNAFCILHDELLGAKGMDLSMAGFILENTLSDNGTVTRGVCRVNDEGYLAEIVETSNIRKTEDGAASDNGPLDPKSHVSMNMWGLTPDFVPVLKEGFVDFFKNLTPEKEMKGEYLLPIFIGELLEKKAVTVKVLETKDKWFGITYREDVPAVQEAFRALVAGGAYEKELFSDLKPVK